MVSKTYLSVEQVAKRFGINTTTVYRLAQRGALPAFKVGSKWRFSEEMLESWVADQVTAEWLRADDREKDQKIDRIKQHRWLRAPPTRGAAPRGSSAAAGG